MLTKPLVINRLSTGLLADGSESGWIVNNLAFALWITGNRLGNSGKGKERKARMVPLRGTCLSSVLITKTHIPYELLFFQPFCLESPPVNTGRMMTTLSSGMPGLSPWL